MPLPRHRSLTWRPVRACETGTQSLERFGNHKSPKESERIPLSQLRFNVLYEGTVTKLLKYGFLVDIGAQKNAIVHISEVKAGYVANLRNDVNWDNAFLSFCWELNPWKEGLKPL
ncbi:hypothetical protein Gasu2_38110 [Galdieria sulphuraria]|nr:hypothetical protein Gasu2_38110 [Galdieria sulphuraria]